MNTVFKKIRIYERGKGVWKKKNSIVKDIAIGVAVGAAVTMLRKENREKFASNARRAKKRR
ncbi:hypothetical protein GCM10020331_014420 [Ectobacillus funiculus]